MGVQIRFCSSRTDHGDKTVGAGEAGAAMAAAPSSYLPTEPSNLASKKRHGDDCGGDDV